MGYRSEIGILITLPESVKGEEIINKFKKAWCYGELEDCFDIDDEESMKGFVFIHSKIDLKWYEGFEGFEDVNNTMKLIRSWEDMYSTGGISFLRIGEDYEDNEEEYYGEPDRYMCLERSMSW